MKMSMGYTDIAEVVCKQINNFWYISLEECEVIKSSIPCVLRRLDGIFSSISNKYYCTDNGETVLNLLHSGQYTMFLYELSKYISGLGRYGDLCDKIYSILKMFSSADIFYAVDLPDVYFFDHPMGSVLGRAEYGNYFVFMQGCTVGNNKGRYPTLGEHVYMMSGSKVLGDCTIGDHVILSANSYVIDRDVPPYSIVFPGEELIIKPISEEKFNQITRGYFKLQ